MIVCSYPAVISVTSWVYKLCVIYVGLKIAIIGCVTLLNSTSWDNYTFVLLPQPNNYPFSDRAKEWKPPHAIFFIFGKFSIF